jgi:hypothetical protein
MITPRTIPANPQPGERWANLASGCTLWSVYDENGDWLAGQLTEADARALVFVSKAVGFLRMLANHPEVRLSMFAGDLLELLEVPT